MTTAPAHPASFAVEVDLDAIASNVATLRERVGPAQVMAVPAGPVSALIGANGVWTAWFK